MIKFIKILRYERPPQKGVAFEYYVDLGLQKKDPPTLEPGKLMIDTPFLFHSTQRRAKECISFPCTTKNIPTDSLREIPFDLRRMCNADILNKEGSIAVRREFLNFFFRDKLPVKRKNLFFETKEMLTFAADLAKQGTVSVVSHSFRMKLMEALIRTQGRVERHPELFRDYLREDQKTFEFGAGFVVEKEELLFLNQ